ncbi:hypothetical protein CBR_g22220 [Chara braunii]|uniref:PiggyBac transposable element-derived protein domain-containing protein n=1 Tax=Chara braunii TaxID=69332 RepID=A0A388L2K8_CHABU|nr:hypothetical protein CBR_g22220 [Chara braunii]|eukprot:GBG76472.1 hypothetical protein CBR_g22220 [Chara braunii]
MNARARGGQEKLPRGRRQHTPAGLIIFEFDEHDDGDGLFLDGDRDDCVVYYADALISAMCTSARLIDRPIIVIIIIMIVITGVIDLMAATFLAAAAPTDDDVIDLMAATSFAAAALTDDDDDDDNDDDDEDDDDDDEDDDDDDEDDGDDNPRRIVIIIIIIIMWEQREQEEETSKTATHKRRDFATGLLETTISTETTLHQKFSFHGEILVHDEIKETSTKRMKASRLSDNVVPPAIAPSVRGSSSDSNSEFWNEAGVQALDEVEKGSGKSRGSSSDSDSEFWDEAAVQALDEVEKGSRKSEAAVQDLDEVEKGSRKSESMHAPALNDDFWDDAAIIEAVEQAERSSGKSVSATIPDRVRRFTKANDAIDFRKSLDKSMFPIILAYESRKTKFAFEYIVTPLEQFLESYMKMEMNNRHYYELIPLRNFQDTCL